MYRFDPLNPLVNIMDSNKPSMTFSPRKDYKRWKKEAHNMLIELTGYNKFKKTDDMYQVEYEKEFDDFAEIRFTMMTEPHCEMPCHLLLPKGIKNPPLMVCLQGHGTGMHISMGRVRFKSDERRILGGRDIAIQAVANNMAALCIDQRGFGERKENPEMEGPECHIPTMTELLAGRTMVGARVWDISRAIDTVQKHFDNIDYNSIYVMGNSGGGTTSYYAACLEDRIKGLIPSCSVSSYRYSIAIMKHCVCNHIPGIREYFEMGDLAGLIAPKTMVIVAGRHDKTFPLDGVLDAYEKIKSVYKATGNEDKLALIIGEEGHKFYPELAWPKFLELTGMKG